MDEHRNTMWKKIAIVFICLFTLSILLIIRSMFGSAVALENYQDGLKFYEDNYVHKCSEGTIQHCLSPDQEVVACGSQEADILCYDSRLQTVTTCNRADGKIASCVPTDWERWTDCPIGYSAICKQN